MITVIEHEYVNAEDAREQLEITDREIDDIEAQLQSFETYSPECGKSLHEYQEWRLRAKRALNGKRRERDQVVRWLKTSEAKYRVYQNTATEVDLIRALYDLIWKRLDSLVFSPEEHAAIDRAYHYLAQQG